MILIDAYQILVSSTTSHHVHRRVVFPSDIVYYENTIARVAGATCILHCALFNNYYTWLPSHQLHHHKRRKSSAFQFHCLTSQSSGPLTTFQMLFHGFHRNDQSNKKHDLLPSFTLHDFMFSEKKIKTLMKSIEDSFEYTQRSDEFEQIYNTPEKIMKQVCR